MISLLLGQWPGIRLHGRTLLRAAALVLLFPGILLIVVHAKWVFDARLRAYRGFYNGIEVAMTRDQVLSWMENSYPSQGQRARPRLVSDSQEGLVFLMDPEKSSEPNAEAILLNMASGSVTAKSYSPD